MGIIAHMKIIKYLAVFLLFSLPNFVSAQVVFTEIMYNPAGTDTGREWVEIYNTGAESVDITTYKLFENSVNHKISISSGENILPAGQHAVIVDNPEKFLIDHDISGIIFDSTFSFNNTGEEIKLIGAGGEIIDTLNYSPDLGGNDTGNSLQINNNIWIPALPTPDEENATVAVDEATDDSESESDDDSNSDSNTTETGSGSTHEEQTDISNYKPTVKLKISAGRERYVSTNSPVNLELIHNQDDSTKIRTIWSMGDGHNVRGKKVSYIFDRPGEYNVVLNASLNGDLAVARTKIIVTETDIVVSAVDSGKGVDLLLKNNGKIETNIGGYTIKSGKESFILATDTILSSGQILTLSNKTTGLVHTAETDIYFPNGDKLQWKLEPIT